MIDNIKLEILSSFMEKKELFVLLRTVHHDRKGWSHPDHETLPQSKFKYHVILDISVGFDLLIHDLRSVSTIFGLLT